MRRTQTQRHAVAWSLLSVYASAINTPGKTATTAVGVTDLFAAARSLSTCDMTLSKRLRGVLEDVLCVFNINKVLRISHLALLPSPSLPSEPQRLRCFRRSQPNIKTPKLAKHLIDPADGGNRHLANRVEFHALAPPALASPALQHRLERRHRETKQQQKKHNVPKALGIGTAE